MSRSLAVVLLLLLAGCAQDSDDTPVPTSAECLEQGQVLDAEHPEGPQCVEPPFDVRDFEDPNHHCVATQQRDRVHAPDLVGDPWVLGQYWTYSLAVDGEELEPTKLVYYDDQDFDSQGIPQHYMVGTPTREEALRGAILGENPMLGRVHRILYSPHESGDHADMFHFPLCEGSSWQTMFYGEEFTLSATTARLALPTGSDQGFVISGTAASGSTLELSYSPAAQWFTYIDLQRADGGSVQMDLIETGQGYSGPAHFLRGQQDAVMHINGTTEVPVLAGGAEERPFDREDGQEGTYDTVGFAITARLAGSGAAFVEIVDPAGEVAWNRTLGGQDANRLDTIVELPYSSGQWSVRLHGAALDPASPQVEVRVHAVSIYDRSGEV